MNTIAETKPDFAEEAELSEEEAFQLARRKYIGGSDIAAVMGMSPYTTPLKLARLKRGETYHYGEGERTTNEERDQFRIKALMRGKRWEGVVSEMLIEAMERNGHTVTITAVNERYTDPEMDYLASEIDLEGTVDGEEVNFEIKTVHPFKVKEWGEEASDEIPVHYALQAQQGLMIRNRRLCVFGVLFGADDMVPYLVERDDEVISHIRAQCKEFWERFVLGGEDPDPLTWADVCVKYQPPVSTTKEVTPEIYALLMQLRTAQSMLAAYSDNKADLQLQIGMWSEGAANLTWEGETIAKWAEKKWTTLDFDRLKSEHSKLYKDLQVKGSTPSLQIVKKGFSS